MYAVVGCGDCRALWLVEGRPETSQCPRCGTTRGFEKRKQFVTTEDEDHAREVRAAMLAARQGREDAFEDLDSFAELEAAVAEAGIDDETYLAASGLDVEAIAGAGETGDSGSRSREDIVRAALRELAEPTAEDVVAYASEYGVSEEYVRRTLSKFARAGEVSENRGVYRLL